MTPVILTTKMKKSRFILPLVTALIVTIISSCKKDVLEANETLSTGDYQSLADFYAQNGVIIQNFVITNHEIENIITGQLGAEITIPGNSLRDSTGALPAGDVNVTLREVYDVRDMVLTHLPTTSNGSMLESGGMMYLEFSAGNVRYHPVNMLLIKIPISGSPVSGMDVFLGLPDGNTGINWMIPDSSSSFAFADSAGTNYLMFVDSLGYGWINCDRFYQVCNPADVTITPVVDAERNETVDLAVYLLFPSISSVMNVYNTSGPQSVSVTNIPAGMQAVAAVIGVGRITNKAYFGKINFTVTSPQSISIDVSQATDQQIFDALSNL